MQTFNLITPYDLYILIGLLIGLVLSVAYHNTLRPYIAISLVILWPFYVLLGLIDWFYLFIGNLSRKGKK